MPGSKLIRLFMQRVQASLPSGYGRWRWYRIVFAALEPEVVNEVKGTGAVTVYLVRAFALWMPESCSTAEEEK